MTSLLLISRSWKELQKPSQVLPPPGNVSTRLPSSETKLGFLGMPEKSVELIYSENKLGSLFSLVGGPWASRSKGRDLSSRFLNSVVLRGGLFYRRWTLSSVFPPRASPQRCVRLLGCWEHGKCCPSSSSLPLSVFRAPWSSSLGQRSEGSYSSKGLDGWKSRWAWHGLSLS